MPATLTLGEALQDAENQCSPQAVTQDFNNEMTYLLWELGLLESLDTYPSQNTL